MKGKILAICTQEPEYARGLSEYILGRRELLFQVMVFLDLEKLRQFINEHRVDLLLLDDIYAETETMDVKQVFMLCDDRNCKETGIFASAFAAGSFLCDDRIWNQHCLYAERNHSTSQS